MRPSTLALFCCTLLFSACTTPSIEENVISTWPESGEPREIHIALPDSSGTEVKILHGNGRIHMRGVLKAGKREGTWNTYREDGMPWSQVHYVDGLKDGLFRTWHAGGVPHIEGQHRNNQPDSTWHFYSTEGVLVQTEFYGEGAN